MSEGLFRKATIDKVSSPEQLDLLMRITSPVGWLALLTVGVMIAAVGVWSVLGSIPDLVDAQGTLFRGERIYDLKATMSGNLMTLDVKAGSIVAVGQTIATIKREQVGPEAKGATDMQVMAIQGQMQAKQDEIRTTGDQLRANRQAINKNKADIDGFRLQLETDQKAWQLQKQLVDQGLKAPKEMTAIEEKMNGTRSRIRALEADIAQLESNEKSIESRKKGNEAQLGVYEGQIASLRAGGNATAELKTIEAGRVVEVVKSAGDSVKEGEPLVRIERQTAAALPTGSTSFCDGDVHALVYVSAGSSGKVQKGQFVRVSPAGVAKEEYGFIFGKVEWVATYPASTADMSEKLKNDQLVKQFMAAGPVVEARICLEKDVRERKINPFKWSSSGGPPTDTQAGTGCTVSMVVAEKKPYTYVVPAVRKAVGL